MALFNIFKPKELSDEQLILKYKESNDSKYVGELYQRYTHICFAVCMKYLKNEEDAKDAVMQVFEKLLTDLLKHEIQFFQGWLHTLVKNFCLMQLRSRKHQSQFDENTSTANSNISVESFEDDHLTDKILLEVKIEQLETAITQLKNEQKECIELFYLKNKTYTEIQQITGFDYKQVKSFIQNGKRNLKNYLEKNA
ncbi:MAG: sigma-70 family RNA polymerase sigma factor [Bacteroidia bacterium]